VTSDYVTVLTVRHPRDAVMTKRLKCATNGVIYKMDYDDGYLFDAVRIGINDLIDLCSVLIDLRFRAEKMMIPWSVNHHAP
jgi:hypothetical protein